MLLVTTTPSGPVALMLPWTVEEELSVGVVAGSSKQAPSAALHPRIRVPPLATFTFPSTVNPDVVPATLPFNA